MTTCEPTQTAPRFRRLAHFVDRFDPARQSKPISTATLTRWIKQGTKAPNGVWIKLRAVRFPAGWRTSEEWVEQFIDELTNASMETDRAAAGA
jgi:hypothetical protein